MRAADVDGTQARTAADSGRVPATPCDCVGTWMRTPDDGCRFHVDVIDPTCPAHPDPTISTAFSAVL